MTRTVFCALDQRDVEGLDFAPWPGPLGQRVFAEVGKPAWARWLAHQTMLINERRLNMMNAEDRKFLQAEMDKFLSGEDYAKADGYVPPSA